MTDQPDDQPAETFDGLWRESIENHVAAMSQTDFDAMVERTRPGTPVQPPTHLTGINHLSDPADRQRAIMASIQEKQRRLSPRSSGAKPDNVDANGYRGTRSVNASQPAKENWGNLPPSYPANTRRTDTNDI
jgi:hypothetical protein